MAITKGTTSLDRGDAAANTIDCTAFNSVGVNAIVVGFSHEGAPVGETVSDNNSNGYSRVDLIDHTNTDMSVSMYVVFNPTTSSSHVITMTYDGGATRPFRNVGVWPVFGNFDTASQETQSSAQGNSTTIDAGSLTTAGASGLFTWLVNYNARAVAPGSGWTEDQDNNGREMESRLEPAGGTFDPSGTMSPNSDWVGIAVALKEVIIYNANLAWYKA